MSRNSDGNGLSGCLIVPAIALYNLIFFQFVSESSVWVSLGWLGGQFALVVIIVVISADAPRGLPPRAPGAYAKPEEEMLPPEMPPDVDRGQSDFVVIKQDGSVYDGYGKYKGRISEDGYIRDPYGAMIGRITKDGYYFDARDNLRGRVTKDGSFIDAHGNYKGRINEHGSITDEHGTLRGRVQK